MKSLRTHALLFVAVLTAGCQSNNITAPSTPEPVSKQPEAPPPAPVAARAPKLFWLSLDGFRKANVEAFMKFVKRPHSKGFAWLLRQPNWNAELTVTNPTITSSSHISTITCSPPGVHGVVSNSQWDGSKNISGFEAPYDADTYVAALSRQGWRVAAYGYPSIDGSTDNRRAAFGATYANAANKGLLSTFEIGAQTTLELFSFVTKQNTHKVTAAVAKDGKTITYRLTDGSTFQSAVGEWANLVFREGATSQLVAILFASSGPKANIYIAPTMTNAAYPDDFKKRLEAQDIIFSPGKDFALRDAYGDSAFLKAQEHRLNHFTKAAQHIIKTESSDAFFFYLEDLDVLGHQYEGDATFDAIRGEHFAKVDAALGSILELLPAGTDVVIAGDHGMAPTNYEINASRLLPADAAKQLQVNTSGGALFLYGKSAALESMPPANEPWFKKTVQQLRQARVAFDKGRPVFHSVVVKGSPEAAQLGLGGPRMPWILAFAEPGLAVKTSVENAYLLSKRLGFEISEALQSKYPVPMTKGKIVEPVPLGNHGHINSAQAMKTSLVISGPIAAKLSAKSVRMNTDLVPAVADALGTQRPRGCPRK